jgi:NDP-sugar pyrophosphorylase family protein
MTFICLAAGKGTRFGRLGSYLQKCMYPIGLKPFLEYSVESLLNSGVFRRGRDRLVFVIGHKGEQVRDYFGSQYRGVPIAYAEQERALGTGHAVWVGFHAAGVTAEPVIAWLADSYISAEVFAAHAHSDRAEAITIAEFNDGRAYGHRVDIDPDSGRVTRCWKGSSPYVEIGCWRMAPETVQALVPADAASGETGTAPDGEYRALKSLQEQIDRGAEPGYVHAPAWTHLGGTDPSPEYHLAQVFTALAPEILHDGA